MTERTELRRLLAHMAASGFRVYAVYDGGEDEEETERTVGYTDAEVESVVFDVDECSLYVRREAGPRHWVQIVLGNAPDGSELVCDYSYSVGETADDFKAVMDGFVVEASA